MPKTVTRFCSECRKALRISRKHLKQLIREFHGHRPTGSCCNECYELNHRVVEYRP